MNEGLLQNIYKDRNLRKTLARKSHYWFFHIYFPHYIQYKTADFQKEIFSLTEDKDVNTVVTVAFRGSAKSTIMTLSYPIWAMVGSLDKKFITAISLTQQQSRLILSNIKVELETNELLINDFGPFADQQDEWRADSLVISRYETRIMALSSGESIRGIRHKATRPDLIICDDVEDLESVKTKDGRDRTARWFFGDVMPLGDKFTKTVVIGNLLHEDSLMMKLKKHIRKNPSKSVFKEYSLLDKNTGEIIWPGKYPNIESVDEEKSKIDLVSWKREYLLTIVPDNDYVILPEWIKHYESLPSLDGNNFRFAITGVDLAISEKSSADYTAMVTAYVFGYKENMKIYILPYSINKRMDFPKTIEEIKVLSQSQINDGLTNKILVEAVAYQSSLIQQLEKEGVTAIGVSVSGDKRARLSQTTSWIKQGKILFPEKGSENLISQLVGFGVERYDDLADAFSMLILELMKDKRKRMLVLTKDSPLYNSFRY